MMKRLLYIFLSIVSAAACSELGNNPYSDTLCRVDVSLDYPAPYSSSGAAEVTLENMNLGDRYKLCADNAGDALFTVPKGLYRITATDRVSSVIFNGSADKVEVSGDRVVPVQLKGSKAGSIIFKEIYCGGCMKAPAEGTYQVDKYVILHNNGDEVQYLDSLCFGTLYPYNATATNPWVTKDASGAPVFRDFIPVAQCIWQFPGKGRDFPLQPGEDAVLCLFGAIDHKASYPESVNLNKKGYFVCYNTTYFTMTTYHPVPGNNIDEAHWLNVVIKTGEAKAYTFSNTSPAAVIFKAPPTVDLADFVKGNVKPTPTDSHNPVVTIPDSWVMDAVEVFDGSSMANSKRLGPSLDAGYVSLSQTYLGHSLMRKLDSDLTSKNGYEVYMDTNNSSVDFFETERHSLDD